MSAPVPSGIFVPMIAEHLEAMGTRLSNLHYLVNASERRTPQEKVDFQRANQMLLRAEMAIDASPITFVDEDCSEAQERTGEDARCAARLRGLIALCEERGCEWSFQSLADAVQRDTLCGAVLITEAGGREVTTATKGVVPSRSISKLRVVAPVGPNGSDAKTDWLVLDDPKYGSPAGARQLVLDFRQAVASIEAEVSSLQELASEQRIPAQRG